MLFFRWFWWGFGKWSVTPISAAMSRFLRFLRCNMSRFLGFMCRQGFKLRSQFCCDLWCCRNFWTNECRILAGQKFRCSSLGSSDEVLVNCVQLWFRLQCQGFWDFCTIIDSLRLQFGCNVMVFSICVRLWFWLQCQGFWDLHFCNCGHNGKVFVIFMIAIVIAFICNFLQC